MRPIRQGDPGRAYYHTLYPVAKGIRDCFAQDVVCAVHVRVQAAPRAGAATALVQRDTPWLAGADLFR